MTVGSSTGKRKPIVYNKVNIAMRNFSFAGNFPVTASVGLPGGGQLKIDGTAGPINPTDAALTPVQAKLHITKLDLAQSALVDPTLGITGSGRLRRHTHIRWSDRKGQRNPESLVAKTRAHREARNSTGESGFCRRAQSEE